MATTRILTAATYSEWDPAVPVATIDLVSDDRYRVAFTIGGWIDTAGRDTAPTFSSFAEAQAIAEKFGDALSAIKAAAAKEITALVAELPVKERPATGPGPGRVG